MNRCRDTQAPVLPISTDFEFSVNESNELKDLLAVLSNKQINAARIDASGMDTITIASSIKVAPQTITTWRSDYHYIRARNLFSTIINHQGLKFRLDAQRNIMAPAYAELMRRMVDPRIRMKLKQAELLKTIEIIGKETRLDQEFSGGDENNEDLADLQRRRKNFSMAKQQQAIDEIKNDSKIIAFPTGTNG